MKSMISHKRKNVAIASLALVGIFLLSSFSTQAFAFGTLGGVQFSPSTDLVNSSSQYIIRFSTATTATINQVLIIFPSGFGVGSAKLMTEGGLPSATKVSSSGQVINYSFTANNIAKKTNVFLIFSGIKNPSSAGSFSTTAIVQTWDGTTMVDNGTSAAFSIRELTGSDISTSSSLTIAALSTGILTVTGAATFKSSISATGLIAAHGGIATTTLSASGAATFASTVTTTGLLRANGGISTSSETFGGTLILSSGLISDSSASLMIKSTGSNPFGGGGTVQICSAYGGFSTGTSSYPFSVTNGVFCTGSLLAWIDSSGGFSSAKGLFHVDNTGQIASQSVGFQSFDSNPLGTYQVNCGKVTQCVITVSPSRATDYLIIVWPIVHENSCIGCSGREDWVDLNTTDTSVTLYPTVNPPSVPSEQSFFVGDGAVAQESMVFLAHTVPGGTTVSFTILVYLNGGDTIQNLQAEIVPYPM